MPIVEIANLWIVVLDTCVWLIIHLAVAWLGTNMPATMFNPESWLFRERAWEKQGAHYKQFWRIKTWKGLLPDGAAWFAGGFAKKQLQDTSVDYYRQFVLETCRGEAVHWAVILFIPLFAIWNPPWAMLVITFYALIANMPCIIAQRYNRIRFQRVVARMARGSRGASNNDNR